jgi:hypothetical protein
MVASDALLCKKICVWSLKGRNNFYLALGKALLKLIPVVFVNSENTKNVNIW